ncbi:efflux RND transporter periplasmic adaptor subunit [Propionivibrio dicarboxylicus]|uniref:RND family efflux transporter, MFP subunit n=1 Tax=Propionivibrio dicarboxylicus TaxID=83767 RepID=A0A1G7VKL7_9RHOO|nr:efflux RND transporter periplasmic adaptor subunit [Propionivibrio dicarboxylicus]SDG60356.1 RND family efflux transporter, MFP subunit [Propionivibrio dicarboxylicus]
MRGERTAMLAMACVVALVSGCGKSDAPPEPQRPVLTRKVGLRGEAVGIGYTGEIRSRYETPLAFRVSGKISERFVNVGDTVKAGDVLARLDPADARLALASAQSQADLAAAELRRYRDLRAKNFVSQSVLDAKETAYATAVSQADLAKNQSAYTVLRADKAGVIDQVNAEIGQVVAAGQAVMRHSRLDTPEIAIAVPESRVAEIRAGQSASIRLWADGQADYRGHVRELAAVADAATRTYAARVTIDNPDGRFRLGMTARVEFANSPARTASAPHAIPLGALFQHEGKPAVWVVGADQTVSLRPVVVLSYGESEVLLANGLQPDDRIVIAGVHKLSAGEKIRAIDAQASP